MNMLEVMQRRGELLAKIAAQREQLAWAGARWQIPLSLADRGLAAARILRSRPVLVFGVVALVVVRRHGMVTLVKRGWRVWKAYRYLAKLSQKLHPQSS